MIFAATGGGLEDIGGVVCVSELGFWGEGDAGWGVWWWISEG